MVCRPGAPETLQHPDHTDREREHGARGERESWEKEERAQDWISKLPISILYVCLKFTSTAVSQAFIILLPPPPRLRNGSRKGLPTAEDARRSWSCEDVNKFGRQFKSGSQLRLVVVSVFVLQAAIEHHVKPADGLMLTGSIRLPLRGVCSPLSITWTLQLCWFSLFLLVPIFFFVLALNLNKCIYARWFYHIPLLNSICTLFIVRKTSFYFPMWSRKCLFEPSQINLSFFYYLMIVFILVNERHIQKRTFIFITTEGNLSTLLKLLQMLLKCQQLAL